jgi:hypothetical protein
MRSHCACCSAVGSPSARISESWFADSIAVQLVSARIASRAYRREASAITEFNTRACGDSARSVRRQRVAARTARGVVLAAAGRRSVNLSKVCLHVDLNREGDLVQQFGGLVNPTTLMLGAGKDLLDRLPETERAVADREVGRDLETSTGPTPVWIARCGPWPCRTSLSSARA